MYHFIEILILIILALLLFALPLAYSIKKDNWDKSFLFTWAVWAIVLFIFGILTPALAKIREQLTGEHTDIQPFGFIAGIVMGWLPGLILPPTGSLIRILLKKFKQFRTN